MLTMTDRHRLLHLTLSLDPLTNYKYNYNYNYKLSF